MIIGASSSSGFFILIIIAFAFLWFVLVRPQKRRQTEQQRMMSALQVGDRVLTAGGIYGEVTALRDDDVTVQIAPGVEVTVARRAIGGVITPPEAAPDPEPEPPEPAEEPPAETPTQE